MNERGAGGGTVLTVGHSNHRLESFVALLREHHVEVLADVRSVPRSAFVPHFNREALAAALEGIGIDYLYLGCELGGRSDDPACYEDGRVRYDRVAATAPFRDGLAQVTDRAGTHRVALMCAEKEPLDCHRTLLVARALDELGLDVAHILDGGGLEPHAQAMDRLIDKFGLDGDLFLRSRDERVAQAIARQSRHVAFAGGPAGGSGRAHA